MTGRPRQALLLSAAAILSAERAASASAPTLELEAYPEGVRFDAKSGGPMGAAGDELAHLRLDSGGRVLLRGVRDEVLGILVRARGVVTTVTATVASFTNPAGKGSSLRTQLLRAESVRIEHPSESSAIRSLGPGDYPDILVPLREPGVTMTPAGIQLWLDIYIPENAQAGVHTASLIVGDTKLILDVRVLDHALPQADIARLGAVNFGSLLDREREDPKAFRAWLQMAHAHRLSIEVMRMTPKIDAGGRIDWNGWAARVGPYVTGQAFTAAAGYVGPRAGQPIVRFIIPHTDWWPIPNPQGSHPSDPQRWSETLREWEQVVSARGWFDLRNATDWILFINSLDEPKRPKQFEMIRSYGPLLEKAQLKDRRHVWFRVDGIPELNIEGWDDTRQIEELGNAVVDLWNVHGAPSTIPWPLLEKRRTQHGERVIFYASNSGGEPAYPPLVVDAALIGARAWGWIVVRYGLDGALNWEIDSRSGCISNPRCSPGGRLNLDATLIFRGEEVGAQPNQPIASMRLKLLRRGAQDAALLALLSKRDPDRARRLTARMVPRALGDRIKDGQWGRWPLRVSAWQQAHEELLDALAPTPVASPVDPLEDPVTPTWFWGVVAIVLMAAVWFGFRHRHR